jgi:F420-dependent oxidoreductase-like protein
VLVPSHPADHREPAVKVSAMLESGATGGSSPAEIVALIRELEWLGFHRVWLPHNPPQGCDPFVVFALANNATDRISFGTAVTPVWIQHPHSLLQTAMTVQAATKGRFVLGVGVSDRPTVDGAWGLHYSRPVAYVREYLTLLGDLAHGGKTDRDLERLSAHAEYEAPEGFSLEIYLSALNPRMLRLAGEMADGLIVYLMPPSYLAEQALDYVREGAAAAGRSPPHVTVMLPVIVTDQVGETRDGIDARFGDYFWGSPSYEPMFKASGCRRPSDVAIVGDEATVTQRLAELTSYSFAEVAVVPWVVDADTEAGRRRTLTTVARWAQATRR